MCSEAGKGGITVRDIQKMAKEHDFIWSEKEFADMVYFFDSNGDGKVSIFCKLSFSIQKKRRLVQLITVTIKLSHFFSPQI